MKMISPHPLFNPSTTNKKLVTTRSQQHKNHRRKKSSIDSIMMKQEGISDIKMDQVTASNHTRTLTTVEMVCSPSFQENDLPQEVTAADETKNAGGSTKEEVERHAAAAAACTSNGKKQNRKHLRKKKQESQSVSNETKRVSMILEEDPPAPHKDHTHNSNHGHWTSLEKFNVNRFDLLLNGKEPTATTSATSNDMGSYVTEIRSSMCNKCTEDCNLCKSPPLSTLHGAGKKSNVLHDEMNQGLGIPSTTTNVASTTRETADHHDAKNPIEMECHFPLSNESKSNAFTQVSIHDDCVHPYSYYNFDDCSTHDEHNYYYDPVVSKNFSEQEQEDVYPTPWWWMEYPFVSNYDHLEPYQQDYHGMYYAESFIPTIAGITVAEESTTSCNIVGYEEVNIGGCVYFHPIFE